jgi:hypothetical protein
MTTKRINSKGQVIEELELDNFDIRAPFQSPKSTSPKSTSPKRSTIIEQSEKKEKKEKEEKENCIINHIQDETQQQQEIEEMIAWSTYYLNCKKNNINLNNIYF